MTRQAGSRSVIVTGAGSSTGAGVVKGLLRQTEMPVRVVACDLEPLSAGAHLAHAYRQTPGCLDPRYLEAMLAICEEESARLLIPVVDQELPLLAAARERFEAAGVMVAVSPADALAICDDKERTAAFFKTLGLATPQTWRPTPLGPPPNGFPVILKPRTGGRGSLGVACARDGEEYAFHLRRAGDCIVQEFIEGDEYTIDTLSDFAARPLAVVPRRRLEVRSGISYKGIVVKDERMISAACRIVEDLRIVGAACIQCFVRGEEIVFLEINPRFGGGTAFTVAGAGVNTPLMLARAAFGEQVPAAIGRFQEGATLLRYWDEVIVPPGPGARGRRWV